MTRDVFFWIRHSPVRNSLSHKAILPASSKLETPAMAVTILGHGQTERKKSNVENSKTCTKCGQVKPMDSKNFYSDKSQSSGWKPECRECTLALKRIFYANNKDRLRAKASEYRRNNPETWKQVKASYRKRNPEKLQADRRIRYMRKYGGRHKYYTVNQVLDLYGSDCHICGKPIDLQAPRQTSKHGYELGLHIDHVIRLADGGDDVIENVRPAHGLCNQKKN